MIFIVLAVVLIAFKVGLRQLVRRSQNPDSEAEKPPRWYVIALVVGVFAIGVWVAFAP